MLVTSESNSGTPRRTLSILDSPTLARVERARLRLEASRSGQREDSLERSILDPKVSFFFCLSALESIVKIQRLNRYERMCIPVVQIILFKYAIQLANELHKRNWQNILEKILFEIVTLLVSCFSFDSMTHRALCVIDLSTSLKYMLER